MVAASIRRMTGYDYALWVHLRRSLIPWGTKRFFLNLVHGPRIWYQYRRLTNQSAPASPILSLNGVRPYTTDGRPAHSEGLLKVLVLTEGDASIVSRYFLWDALDESGLAEQHHIYVDEYRQQHSKMADMTVLQWCLVHKPDCVVSLALQIFPKHETLNLIGKMGIPVVALLPDTIHPFAIPRPFYRFSNAPELDYPFADLYVLFDTSFAHLKKAKKLDRYLCLPDPRDGRVYHSTELDRDIGISFFGNVGGSGRGAIIETLEKALGIQVYSRRSFNQEKNLPSDHQLTELEYVNVLQRSKIVLNFPFDIPFGGKAIPQWKGRGLEATQCGAMLLELDSVETHARLEPLVDYVPYSSLSDLADKAQYYLEHDDERAAIALSGYRKITERYSSTAFWTAVFGRVGVLPTSPASSANGDRNLSGNSA